MLTLVVVLLRPRYGAVLHVVTLVLACLSDQFRMQPQIFGLAVLILSCSFESGLRMGRWVLASTWLWAGIHKLISPDWLGHHAWSLLEQAGLDPNGLYVPFSLIVAFGELALGLAAFIATYLCRMDVRRTSCWHPDLSISAGGRDQFERDPMESWPRSDRSWVMLRSSEQPASGVAERTHTDDLVAHANRVLFRLG